MNSCKGEKIVTTICHDHCTNSCVLKLHVRDGIITRIETDDGPEPQFRCCLRGRAFRQYVYHPDRLKYPLRRTGSRGEGKFERISWDEALEIIASRIKQTKDTYGARSIILLCSAGDLGWLHNGSLIDRVLVGTGGYTGVLGTVSDEGTWFGCMATYGNYVRFRPSLAKSRLIIFWGFNPVVSRQYTNLEQLAQIKESGARFYSVDPRYTETAALMGARWIPIRPGTDSAMLIAMADVIIEENLQDQEFLDKYTVGFDVFKRYVTGDEDGVPKTPAWAEQITGVPADTIVRLAREYAASKPAALIDSFAPGRTAYGEQFSRAVFTLSAITGNLKIQEDSGGRGFPARERLSLGPFIGLRIGGGENPVHLSSPLRKNSAMYQRAPRSTDNLRAALYYTGGPTTAYLNRVQVADAILKGRSGGYPEDYKLLYMVTINWLNQYGDTNKIAQALKKLDFVVVQEQFMTPTARFADMVLPTCTIFERNDLTAGFGIQYYGYMNKVIKPIGEAKSQYEIAQGLAAKLGIPGFREKTEEEWLRTIAAECKDIPDYDTFKKAGMHRANPPVSLAPFGTPSGKIEIYSQALADMNNPLVPPIPEYIETWESRNDPLAKRYPLQLITTHYWRRTHSKFDNLPWLRELEQQSVLINGDDAKNRGIEHGDLVRIFNDRGQIIIPAKVSERIMPGVVDIPEGAAFNPDRDGIDRGGCPNVLLSDKPSPGGAFASNTALVQVEKVSQDFGTPARASGKSQEQPRETGG